MKTPFLFALIALVVSEAPKPSFASIDAGCKLTNAGHEYTGNLSVTVSGRTCHRWDSDGPHKQYFKSSKLFPEGSARAAGNRCRNPDGGFSAGVWCYTTDPKVRWELCNVKLCASVPVSTQTPKPSFPSTGEGGDQQYNITMSRIEYVGPLSVTKSGRTCQRWDSDNPHFSNYKASENFPEGSAEAAGNRCRNPDGNSKGLWCYTTDPKVRWELCDVKLCT